MRPDQVDGRIERFQDVLERFLNQRVIIDHDYHHRSQYRPATATLSRRLPQ
jgi:hypothetical protein